MPLFVVVDHYVVPLPEVDLHVAAHRAFLGTLYEEGIILGSGRMNPPVGGVILVHGSSLDEVQEIFAKDPFAIAKVARYEFLEFDPSPLPLRSPELDAFMKRP